MKVYPCVWLKSGTISLPFYHWCRLISQQFGFLLSVSFPPTLRTPSVTDARRHIALGIDSVVKKKEKKYVTFQRTTFLPPRLLPSAAVQIGTELPSEFIQYIFKFRSGSLAADNQLIGFGNVIYICPVDWTNPIKERQKIIDALGGKGAMCPLTLWRLTTPIRVAPHR